MHTSKPQRPKHVGRAQRAGGRSLAPTRSHAHATRNKRCHSGGKVRFRHQNDAKGALTRAAYSRAYFGTSSRRNEVRTYLCQVCKGWHLTSETHVEHRNEWDAPISVPELVVTDDSMPAPTTDPDH